MPTITVIHEQTNQETSVDFKDSDDLTDIAFDAAKKLGFSSYANVKSQLRLRKESKNIVDKGWIIEKTSELNEGGRFVLSLYQAESNEAQHTKSKFEHVSSYFSDHLHHAGREDTKKFEDLDDWDPDD